MSYRVVSFTMAQVRQGALAFNANWERLLRECEDIKVYSSARSISTNVAGSRIGLAEISSILQRTGVGECERLGMDLQVVAEIPDHELPRRRTLVLGCRSRERTR